MRPLASYLSQIVAPNGPQRHAAPGRMNAHSLEMTPVWLKVCPQEPMKLGVTEPGEERYDVR